MPVVSEGEPKTGMAAPAEQPAARAGYCAGPVGGEDRRTMSPTIPEPVFLGFCARQLCCARDLAFLLPQVAFEEVCSTSDCFSKRPPDWIEDWDFNRASCWDTEDAAWARVPEADRGSFRL